MRKRIFLLVLLPFLAVAETWLPPERPLPDLTDLAKRNEIVAESPALGSFKPDGFASSLSLDGTWKLTPLESSEKPFGPLNGSEREFARPDFDDSGWHDIRVPLNWYLHPENRYGKIFRHGEVLDPLSTGGGLVRGVVNSYVKGWYRREFRLDTVPAGKRAILCFERIGYQAELFVNGKPAPVEHQGDFVGFEVDVTELLKPGRNVLALRVRSDIRPISGRFPHTYGAMWSLDSYKGGIWGHVKLDWVAEPRVASVRLVAPASGKLEVHAEVVFSGKEPLEVTPGVSVVRARKGAEPRGREYDPVLLRPGLNRLKFTFDQPRPELWSVQQPNLYFATLFFRNGERILSADTTRFGFRDFEIRGTKFYLNGQETFLFFESAHSVHFGGYPSPDGHAVRPAERIAGYRRLGYNMIRTAHMPVPQEVLDLADELGMMIYDEWSMCFVTGIDKAVFEKNNLKELAGFVAADHNHPSVVMWSLGNEVSHKLDPELPGQLDKQYDLVRELDLQKRPICSFAGLGDTELYGSAKLKTDVIDIHCYIGMTDSWTLARQVGDLYYRQLAGIYGDGKTFKKPYIISECVGGGWGYAPDPGYRSNVPGYLEQMRRPFHWGQPGSAGYSGAIGVAAAADPERGFRYFQNRMGRRILEQFRLDPRYAGYAPWFADHSMRSAPVWNQEHYPGLRLPGSFAPRQLLAGTELELECFLLNAGPELADPELRVSLEISGTETELGKVKFPVSSTGSRLFRNLRVTVPMLSPGAGELKLTLFDGGREAGRNSYDVTLHAKPEPVEDPLPVALLSGDPALKTLLKELRIEAVEVTSPEQLAGFRRAAVAGRHTLSRDFQRSLRNWVEEGGFLLALECESGFIPGFSEYRSLAVGAPLVELVAAGHPLFDGMSQDDFDTWAENGSGYVAETAFEPLDETLLAAAGIFTHNRRNGAVLVEAGFGKGRLLISAFNARRIAGRNGAAAKWLGNLLHYFASAAVKPAQPEQLVPLERPTEFSADMAQAKFVDLRTAANRAFRDDEAGDGRGGWTDQGENDFRNMPAGKQRDAGVDFELIDPAENSGFGCVMLRGRGFPDGPAARRITVHARAQTLYFLHTAAYVSGSAPVAHYLIRYADRTTAKFPLVPGRNIADWWTPSLPEEAFPAFSRPNGATGRVSFFVAAWENPAPEKEIESIDFVSAGTDAVAVLAALTLLPPAESTNLIPFSNGKQQWVCGCDGPGQKAVARAVRLETPVGQAAMRVDFPAAENGGCPFAIAPAYLGGMKGRRPTHLSLLFRSRSEGVVDVQLPEKEWRGWLSAPLDLGLSRGEWVRVRLDLAKDFRLSGQAFSPAGPRSEIGFFNGKERRSGYPRGPVSFEVADIRYEFGNSRE